jgi:hypothetical protein
MFIICDELLRDFVAEHMPEFAVDNLLLGTDSYTLQRTIAAQELGRCINEDAVKTVFETYKLDGNLLNFSSFMSSFFMAGYLKEKIMTLRTRFDANFPVNYKKSKLFRFNRISYFY